MSWYWGIWIAATIIVFAIGEDYALRSGKATLSRTVWNIQKGWPLFAVLFGLVFGGLAVHFFWVAQGCDIAVKAVIQ